MLNGLKMLERRKIFYKRNQDEKFAKAHKKPTICSNVKLQQFTQWNVNASRCDEKLQFLKMMQSMYQSSSYESWVSELINEEGRMLYNSDIKSTNKLSKCKKRKCWSIKYYAKVLIGAAQWLLNFPERLFQSRSKPSLERFSSTPLLGEEPAWRVMNTRVTLRWIITSHCWWRPDADDTVRGCLSFRSPSPVAGSLRRGGTAHKQTRPVQLRRFRFEREAFGINCRFVNGLELSAEERLFKLSFPRAPF